MNLLKISFLLFLFSLMSCKSPNGKSQTANIPAGSNHLINESSPYLLQHAKNPVDWYPWGEEALNKAKAEDKMIIISVGYAACHWCHVMEHESFEDTLVSKVMNENFVCIKVDREERPDVDDVYMTACHMASKGSCGWPLNAFALPDGKPFWAGTYFPKNKWLDVMDHWIKTRKDEPAKLKEYAEQISQGIQQSGEIELNTDDHNFSVESLNMIANNFLANVDFNEGGRKNPPKFPMPNNYEFLLAYHYLYKDSKALDAVTVTLDKMANGGIYDHLGGGFSRYSTDNVWLVPHFEKMLYDNGQLVSLYSQAYQLTKKPLYKKVVEETLAFIKREMTSKEGGFYSSFDADSEGEEGKFYVWTKKEIESILQDEKASKIFCDYYEVSASGNWEHHNILHRKKPSEKILKKHNITQTQLDDYISNAKSALFKVRTKRIHPGLDDKVLTSWNSLMLKGYVDAYKAFGNPEYLAAALKNANFISKNMMQKDGRLNRNYKDGKSVINAFLDDYALTINSFMAIYEVTFDEKWLSKADELSKFAISHFYDEKSAMFNYTSDLDVALVARKKEISDNVIPGSNSTMARSLYQLGTYLYNTDYIDKAKQMLANIAPQIETSKQPNFFSNWCSLYTAMLNPPYEVAILGENHKAIRNDLMKNYLPNAILLGGNKEGSLELLTDKLQEGETMIYVCQNKVCKIPVMEVDKALNLMKD